MLLDPFIRSWRLLPEGFRHFLFTNATASDFYRPLQRVTYTWDYAWFDRWAGGYHLTSILVHAGAAVALFLFAERFLTLLHRSGARRWAGLTAGCWAIHPLHTSAVCYISGRADLLAAFFGFLGLWLALGGERRCTLGAIAMFFCAACSKESGIIFLPLCIAVFLFLRRPAWNWLALSLLVVGAYGALRFTAAHLPAPAGTPLTWAARPIITLRALAEYAGLFLLPLRLHMERDVLPFGRVDFLSTIHLAQNREFQTLLGALLTAGLVLWMRWTRRREYPALAALGCFVLAYLPVCGLFSLNASVAEHWLYVPSAFLLLAALLSLSHIPAPRSLGLALLCLWAAFLGVRTLLRNADWHDQATFLERTIAQGGRSARMLINRGVLESSRGDQKSALADFNDALILSPDQPFGLLGLGTTYLRDHRYDLARAQFEKALALPLIHAEAMQDLAVVEYQQEHRDRLDLLAEGARLAPENWALQKRYISHLAERGQVVDAISVLRDWLAAHPYMGEGWHLLGDLWAHVHQLPSAQRAYEKATDLDVHDDEAERRAELLETR